MFERKRHLREVIETKSKQIANRDKLIDGQRAEIHQYQEENKALCNRNNCRRSLFCWRQKRCNTKRGTSCRRF